MENDLYNEKKQQLVLKDQLMNKMNTISIHKQRIINEYINLNKTDNLDNCDLRTVSTHKNSADSLSSINSKGEKEIPLSPHEKMKKDMTNIYIEEPKIRRDNFGKEIKKGGKHKIAFSDDLDVIQSIIPEENFDNRSCGGNGNRFHEKKIKYSLPRIKLNKRSNSLNKDSFSTKNIIYKIMKIKTKSKKKLKDIHVINVENLKKETKLNTFCIKNRTALAEEENVSCSCYCSIW